MSQFQSMCLIPKDVISRLKQDGGEIVKQALSSGVIRQLNTLDVNDGGRVIIRNDDHYKTNPGSSEINITNSPSSEKKAPRTASILQYEGRPPYRSQDRIDEVNQYHGIPPRVYTKPAKVSTPKEDYDIFSEPLVEPSEQPGDLVQPPDVSLHEPVEGLESYKSTPGAWTNGVRTVPRLGAVTAEEVGEVLEGLKTSGVMQGDESSKYLSRFMEVDETQNDEPMDVGEPQGPSDRTLRAQNRRKLITTPVPNLQVDLPAPEIQVAKSPNKSGDKIMRAQVVLKRLEEGAKSPNKRENKIMRAQVVLKRLEDEGIMPTEVAKNYLSNYNQKLKARGMKRKSAQSPGRNKLSSPKEVKRLRLKAVDQLAKDRAKQLRIKAVDRVARARAKAGDLEDSFRKKLDAKYYKELVVPEKITTPEKFPSQAGIIRWDPLRRMQSKRVRHLPNIQAQRGTIKKPSPAKHPSKRLKLSETKLDKSFLSKSAAKDVSSTRSMPYEDDTLSKSMSFISPIKKSTNLPKWLELQKNWGDGGDKYTSTPKSNPPPPPSSTKTKNKKKPRNLLPELEAVSRPTFKKGNSSARPEWLALGNTLRKSSREKKKTQKFGVE